ncbi:hypothetical protein MFIFM68171_06717 [Madurella fahalii]|uniref:NACHT-NTPase and P-loop NTPases N-terminal domain-containing protein n=1 Tax=Madurella fahalii TaxID=1157608 RepID=A0ABQ0GFG9_9PEZI
MAALEPITTVISLFNEAFTLTQTTAALISAPEEVKAALRFLSTVDEQINYTKALRDRVFDITNADTAKDGTFILVQTAIRNAHNIVTANADTLQGSKKSVAKKGKDGSRAMTTRTRFSWVIGGRDTYDGNLQELQIHYQTLMRVTDLLERMLAEMDRSPPPRSLPFGDVEVLNGNDGGHLSPVGPEGIYHLLGPRKSQEILLGRSDDEEWAGNHDNCPGSSCDSEASELGH